MINKMELQHERRKKVFNIKKAFADITFTEGLFYVVAFLIARASIMDDLTPFGIALLTSYLLKNKKGILLATILSISIITIQSTNSYYYLGTIWVITTIYKLLSNKIKFTTFKLALISSIILATIKGTFVILGDYYLYDIVMGFFEGIIIFSLAYIFSYSMSFFEEKFKKVFTNEELICGSIMFALAVSGIGEISILDMSLKNIIGIFLVILFSYTKGSSTGTLVGITIGLVTSMSTPNMPLIIALYGFSGLLAGLFKDLGRIGVILGFILGYGIMTFYINGFAELLIHPKEIIFASFLVIGLSNNIKKMDNMILIGAGNGVLTEERYKNKLRELTYKRLMETSKAFEELSHTFKKVSQKGKIIEKNDISNFIDTIAEDVCKGCSMSKFCWGSDFYTTYQAMFDTIETIEYKGSITEDDLPEILNKRCIKSNILIDKYNYLFNIYKLNYEWENRLTESRQLVSEQMEGISKIINNLANDILKDSFFNENVEKEIYIQLKNKAIDIKDVIVTDYQNGNFEIYLELKKDMDSWQYEEIIIPVVSEIVGFEIERDRFSSSFEKNSYTNTIKLVKANKFGAITKTAILNESHSYISGDSYTFGERDNGYYVALSDGMGVGEKANEESNAAIMVLEKLLDAGFDKEIAIKTINSLLVLKSNDEMFATVDMSLIDLSRGRVQFIKMGSAPTFIKRKDKVEIVNSQTLPLGILKDIDFQVYEGQLEDGDLIIMMSDGVLDALEDVDDKEKTMIDIIQKLDSFNPQTVADNIIKATRKSTDKEVRDDMTVLVTKVWKRR